MDVDRELVNAATAGSREAFDELVRRYQARIFNLARALTGNEAEAEDLAQDAFVRAYRAIRKFRGDSSFKTWLYRIATNVIRTHLARKHRWRWVWGPSPDGGDPAVDEVEAGRTDAESDLVTRDAVDRALATLPDELRIAVTLRDVHGLEYREIADMMGVPIGTVESRIFRARRRLRPLLAPLVGRLEHAPTTPASADTPRVEPPSDRIRLQEVRKC